MTDKQLQPALAPDALYAKSQHYIGKALARKGAKDLGEYQLWSSLALELLGKAALAKIHPSLIADPVHYESLFAASCINVSTDVKTITAKTLFERLRHIIPAFDETVKSFCTNIALRRNAELHSGATPFQAMRLEAWEAHFWYACQRILEHMQSSLDEWLGATQAAAPKAIIRHTQEAKGHAVRIRIESSKKSFESRKSADRESMLRDAENRQFFHYNKLFTLTADRAWDCRCPACGGKAYLAGIKSDEVVVDTHRDETAVWEEVETLFVAEQFRCPVCMLTLDGSDEIQYANLDPDHSVTEEREMEYEDDYGND